MAPVADADPGRRTESLHRHGVDARLRSSLLLRLRPVVVAPAPLGAVGPRGMDHRHRHRRVSQNRRLVPRRDDRASFGQPLDLGVPARVRRGVLDSKLPRPVRSHRDLRRVDLGHRLGVVLFGAGSTVPSLHEAPRTGLRLRPRLGPPRLWCHRGRARKNLGVASLAASHG